MSDDKSKAVVMLGGFGHEGVLTTLKALGYELVSLNLDNVTPKTWLKRADKIRKLQETGRLAATVMYLHTTLLLEASKSNYRDAFMVILESARLSKMLIFVFQDNLDGIFAMRDRETREPMTFEHLQHLLDQLPEVFPEELDFSRSRIQNAIRRLSDYQSRSSEVHNLIAALYKSGAEIAPFFARADVTIRLQEFLGDIEQGVFLRLFVPDDRLQADQLKGLLSVLERYLRQVEHQEFSIDARKSEKGVVYIFKSASGLINVQSLNDAFGRFDSFMKLCGDDPLQAASVLLNEGLAEQDAAFLVERYSRDYRRLMLDAKHEFERKTLMLRQRLESEVVEVGASPAISWSNDSLSGILSAAATGGNVAINIGTVSVVSAHVIKSEIDHIVNGSVTYNDNDKLLIELFSQYADRLEALQCRSDLDQLKDSSNPAPARQNAKQRLVGFLRKAASKAGDVAEKVAVEALSKYLELLLRSG